MSEFKQARMDYEAIPIPQELDDRVREGIRQGRRNYLKKRFQRYAARAAACFAVLTAMLNLSPTIALAAAEVPVLGGLFQILTVRDFHTVEDGIRYDVSVPGAVAEGELARQVNALIQEKVDAHLAQAQQDWDDYRDTFFANGGTEEEWGNREMDVTVDYSIKSQTYSRVSFAVTLGEGWVAAREESYYYNLDLAEDRPITLRELLGENWVERCNDAILAGIEAAQDEEGFSYFFSPDEGGFTTVDENTAFYIRGDGVPVVVFPQYSIAAGAAGSPEFPIEQRER